MEEVKNEEKTLIEWEAPERSFKTRNKDFWITAVAILILVSVIFIFIKEFFLIIALASLLFLAYVLSTVPPGLAKYKITNRGIYFGEQFYDWAILERFWLKSSLDSDMIHFGTFLKFPRVISMVIKAENKEQIKNIVIKNIPMIQESPTFIDKTTAWFAKRLPLEDKQN